MRIKEVITETRIYKMDDEAFVYPKIAGYESNVYVYKDPNNGELDQILGRSRHKACRLYIDPKGSIWIWDAAKVGHTDVEEWMVANADKLGFTDGMANNISSSHEGETHPVTILKHGEGYLVWADNEGYGTSMFKDLAQNPAFQRLTNGKARFSHDAGLEYWNKHG